MFFLVKYSKSLEEGSFRNRSADFLWMLLFGSAILVAAAPWVNIQFLGSSLTFMMVRRVVRCWRLQGELKAGLVTASASTAKLTLVWPPPARPAGVCVGSAAPVRQPQLPGHLHVHRPLPALGAAGLLGCAAGPLPRVAFPPYSPTSRASCRGGSLPLPCAPSFARRAPPVALPQSCWAAALWWICWAWWRGMPTTSLKTSTLA